MCLTLTSFPKVQHMSRPNFLSLDPPNAVPITVLKYLEWGDASKTTRGRQNLGGLENNFWRNEMILKCPALENKQVKEKCTLPGAFQGDLDVAAPCNSGIPTACPPTRAPSAANRGPSFKSIPPGRTTGHIPGAPSLTANSSWKTLQ